MEDFWYGMEMEWKKIASVSMEYGKIVFHSIPCPAYDDNFWNGFNNATPLIFEKSSAHWMLQDLN